MISKSGRGFDLPARKRFNQAKQGHFPLTYADEFANNATDFLFVISALQHHIIAINIRFDTKYYFSYTSEYVNKFDPYLLNGTSTQLDWGIQDEVDTMQFHNKRKRLLCE